MTIEMLTSPAEFDLPRGRLHQRKEHLVAEIAADRSARQAVRPLVFGRRGKLRRRVLVFALVIFMISGVAVAATHDWWITADPPPNQRASDIGLGPTRYPDGRIEETVDLERARTVARAGEPCWWRRRERTAATACCRSSRPRTGS